jgi:hypothetical protein
MVRVLCRTPCFVQLSKERQELLEAAKLDTDHAMAREQAAYPRASLPFPSLPPSRPAPPRPALGHPAPLPPYPALPCPALRDIPCTALERRIPCAGSAARDRSAECAAEGRQGRSCQRKAHIPRRGARSLVRSKCRRTAALEVRHVAAQCNALRQRSTTCCSAVQHVAAQCNALRQPTHGCRAACVHDTPGCLRGDSACGTDGRAERPKELGVFVRHAHCRASKRARSSQGSRSSGNSRTF